MAELQGFSEDCNLASVELRGLGPRGLSRLATNCMNVIDTNIWIYSHDTRLPDKQLIAQQTIAGAPPFALPWHRGRAGRSGGGKLPRAYRLRGRPGVPFHFTGQRGETKRGRKRISADRRYSWLGLVLRRGQE